LRVGSPASTSTNHQRSRRRGAFPAGTQRILSEHVRHELRIAFIRAAPREQRLAILQDHDVPPAFAFDLTGLNTIIVGVPKTPDFDACATTARKSQRVPPRDSACPSSIPAYDIDGTAGRRC
jgi:hypothetical protein